MKYKKVLHINFNECARRPPITIMDNSLLQNETSQVKQTVGYIDGIDTVV